MSLILGLISVVLSVRGNSDLAAWLILWGVLLDKLDGSAARLLNASSPFGAQLDSFADFVSFGIAPAALFFFSLEHNEMVHHGWLIGSAAVFVVAVASRLARFNVASPPNGHMMFYGVPTTLIGAVLASGYLTWASLGLPDEWMAAAPFFLLICSFAMVSNVKLPKLRVRKSLALNIFQASNVLFAYAVTPFKLFPEILFLQSLFYLSVGVIWYAIAPPLSNEEELELETQEV